jgi:predicted transcriptional regulator
MKQPLPDQDQDQDRMFALAAEMFRVMSAPTRLKIISHLCEGEKNVSELIALIKTTQPNISQHLNTLHQAGIVGRPDLLPHRQRPDRRPVPQPLRDRLGRGTNPSPLIRRDPQAGVSTE